MDKRLTFNEDAQNYDRTRPTYPAELFADVIAYAGITAQSRALEVGMGTGQTTLPILQTGCQVTAIELGPNMAAYARKKLASFPNLDVVNMDFADYEDASDAFDLFYSATAFHWIPPEKGLPKVRHLLKPGAAAALFWNYPGRDDDPLHRALQEVYAQFSGPRDRPAVHLTANDCDRYAQELEGYGFVDISTRQYHNTRQMDADTYVALQNSYLYTRLLPPEKRRGLFDGIHETIERFGGMISIQDNINLYLAREPG